MNGRNRSDGDDEFVYEYLNWRRTFAVAALLGFAISTLLFFLFANWLPEDWYAPITITCGVAAGVASCLFGPIDRFHRNPDHTPGSITPTERVDRLLAKRESARRDTG